MKKMYSVKRFTLIEMVMVFVILIVLIMILLPNLLEGPRGKPNSPVGLLTTVPAAMMPTVLLITIFRRAKAFN